MALSDEQVEELHRYVERHFGNLQTQAELTARKTAAQELSLVEARRNSSLTTWAAIIGITAAAFAAGLYAAVSETAKDVAEDFAEVAAKDAANNVLDDARELLAEVRVQIDDATLAQDSVDEIRRDLKFQLQLLERGRVDELERLETFRSQIEEVRLRSEGTAEELQAQLEGSTNLISEVSNAQIQAADLLASLRDQEATADALSTELMDLQSNLGALTEFEEALLGDSGRITQVFRTLLNEGLRDEILEASRVPSRAVLAFQVPINEEGSCPEGWSHFETASGRFLRGLAPGETATTGGNDNITLNVAQLPAHTHQFQDNTTEIISGRGLGGSGTRGDVLTSTETRNTSSVGNGQPVNIMPRYVSVVFCRR